jgi:Protein of unknown function (DUF2637)
MERHILMNSPHPAPAAPRRNWARRLVNLLVALVVIAVVAATFVFSYDGVHAIALLGGVSTQLARYYPGLFDAVLVIACVAAVMLRDGRWWARLWAWLVLIVILGAIGVTDVLHAMNYTLRHRPTEGVVAAAPVAAVLLAFSLLLTLLRQSGTQEPQSSTQEPEPTVPVTLDDLLPALPAAPSEPPMALPAAPPAESGRAPDAATAYEEPVPTYAHASDAPREATPQEVVPQAAYPATEANEVIAPEVPTSGVETDRDEPAPSTVPVPTLAPEPPTRPLGIRYAGNGVPGMAGNPQPAKPAASPTAASPTAEATATSQDYWDAEEEGQFAGLVYPAREEDRADPDDAAEGDADGADATEAEGSAPRKTSPELDDDAPPFATAPFASVPRLNRVRSMPAPPEDEGE